MTVEEKREFLINHCKGRRCAECKLHIENWKEGCCWLIIDKPDEEDMDRAIDILTGKDMDPVNHPSHYCSGKYECIDVMLETQGVEAVKSFCLCNAFKYLYRHNGKNALEDIKKAKWYIDKYIELEEGKK